MRFLLLSLLVVGCGSSSPSASPPDSGAAGDSGNGGSSSDAGTPQPAAIACGESIALRNAAPFCVVLQNHELWCSGGNRSGALGVGSSKESLGTGNDFLQVAALGAHVSSVSVGNDNRACAIDDDGALWCWGANPDDYLGLGSSDPVLVPTKPTTLTGKVAEIHLGRWEACARKSDGAVLCWGPNTGGGSLQPKVVDGLPADVTEIAVGATAAYALTSDGSLWAWGGGVEGELGSGESVTSSPAPRLIDGLANVVHVAAGGNDTCAVESDGSVWCWGWNHLSESNPSSRSTVWVSTRVGGLTTSIQSLALGDATSCALDAEGAVFCWGDAFAGGLGGSSVSATAATAATAPGGAATFLAVDENDGCVVRSDGRIRCWGSSPFSDSSDPHTPVDVAGACN